MCRKSSAIQCIYKLIPHACLQDGSILLGAPLPYISYFKGTVWVSSVIL